MEKKTESTQFSSLVDLDLQTRKKFRTMNERDANEFHFDHVFSETAEQDEVYQVVARPLITDLLNGINNAILAYGPTASGKTYTMMGPEEPTHKTKGIIPRIILDIFKEIEAAPKTKTFSIRCSFVEIYNERINDLLDPSKVNLPLHEREGETRIHDVTEYAITQLAGFLTLLDVGNANRAIAANEANDRSSRSHTILSINILQTDNAHNTTKKSCIHLVDLAGSEPLRFESNESTQKETIKINQSLTTLTRVIRTLTGKNRTHVPYRDSILTRLLKESFGGNSRTALILNLSSSSTCRQDTIKTLRFGQHAQRVRNKIKVNEGPTPTQLKLALARSQGVIEDLKMEIKKLKEDMNHFKHSGNPMSESVLTLESVSTNPPDYHPSRSTSPTSTSPLMSSTFSVTPLLSSYYNPGPIELPQLPPNFEEQEDKEKIQTLMAFFRKYQSSQRRMKELSQEKDILQNELHSSEANYAKIYELFKEVAAENDMLLASKERLSENLRQTKYQLDATKLREKDLTIDNKTKKETISRLLEKNSQQEIAIESLSKTMSVMRSEEKLREERRAKREAKEQLQRQQFQQYQQDFDRGTTTLNVTHVQCQTEERGLPSQNNLPPSFYTLTDDPLFTSTLPQSSRSPSAGDLFSFAVSLSQPSFIANELTEFEHVKADTQQFGMNQTATPFASASPTPLTPSSRSASISPSPAAASLASMLVSDAFKLTKGSQPRDPSQPSPAPRSPRFNTASLSTALDRWRLWFGRCQHILSIISDTETAGAESAFQWMGRMKSTLNAFFPNDIQPTTKDKDDSVLYHPVTWGSFEQGLSGLSALLESNRDSVVAERMKYLDENASLSMRCSELSMEIAEKLKEKDEEIATLKQNEAQLRLIYNTQLGAVPVEPETISGGGISLQRTGSMLTLGERKWTQNLLTPDSSAPTPTVPSTHSPTAAVSAFSKKETRKPKSKDKSDFIVQLGQYTKDDEDVSLSSDDSDELETPQTLTAARSMPATPPPRPTRSMQYSTRESTTPTPTQPSFSSRPINGNQVFRVQLKPSGHHQSSTVPPKTKK
ncbi:putative Kinesin heavy chain [Blattamonas nauphoetae]|uniref:Kinesin heavy chain n=1 Tax=Blattamonas nauphoetae TaxID=2049346 RepID=A0ABQ9YC18_9EUKA|nr:putative Kinesin heavy chain [Blattamonas nauphoetae]